MAEQSLTLAQRRAAKIVLRTVGDDGFCLAGGAALVATGLSTRPTRDIDAFTNRTIDMRIAGERVKTALEAEGFDVTFDRVFPGFVRLNVSAGRRGRFDVDLGRDHFEWPPVTSSLGPTLSPRELAANKVLALSSRVQARDLADVAVLGEQFDLDDVFADAKVKDAGLNRLVLAEMIRLVVKLDDPQWPDGVDIARVKAFGRKLAKSLEADSR